MVSVSRGVIGRIVSRSQPQIVRGSDAFIITQLHYEDQSCSPYKFEGFQGASAVFKDTANVAYTVAGALDSADLGQVRFDIPATGTTAIKAGDPVIFQQVFLDDNGFLIIPFVDKISFVNPLF